MKNKVSSGVILFGALRVNKFESSCLKCNFPFFSFQFVEKIVFVTMRKCVLEQEESDQPASVQKRKMTELLSLKTALSFSVLPPFSTKCLKHLLSKERICSSRSKFLFLIKVDPVRMDFGAGCVQLWSHLRNIIMRNETRRITTSFVICGSERVVPEVVTLQKLVEIIRVSDTLTRVFPCRRNSYGL